MYLSRVIYRAKNLYTFFPRIFKHAKFYPSIVAIILVLFSLCARGQYCNENTLPTNLRNGLVTFFPFCNSVDDKSISPSTLVTNNVTFGPDRFGNSNSAAQFSRASSSYLFIPANAKFEQPSFTISLWFKTNLIMTGGGPGQNDQSLLAYSPINWFAANAAFGIELTSADNSILQSNMWTSTTFNQYISTSSGIINNSSWFHIAMVYEGVTKTQKIYINGTLYSSRSAEVQYNNQSGLCLGATNQTSSGNFGAFFDGLIDDVGFWNRALADCEITQLYNNYTIPGLPIASITYPGNPFCNSGTALVNKVGANGGVYSSTSGLSINSLSGEIDLSNSNPGTYSVSYTIGSGNCASITETSVVINPLPNGSIITPITPVICEGSLKQIEATGGITYQWYLNSIPIPQALFSSYSATSAGIYTVDLISNKGCIKKASNSLHLSIIKKPVAQFSYDTYCINMPVTFTSQSITLNSGSVSSLWRIDNALNFSGISIKNTFINKGVFKVIHFAIPLICPQLTDSIEKNIIIEEPIQGINYPPVNVFSNKPFVLSARNIGNSFLWSPNQYLSNSQIRNPILTTSKEQLFQIRIAQPSGCVTVDTQLVRIFNASEIYVPKGFTPDNDGTNDRLYPILVGIQEMRYFTIMNRWGNVLYNNKNASLTTGWDGTFKGTKLPMDTYVWIAEGIDVDGKIITRNGNTILIR